jgi:hypothetical protein
MACGLAWHFVNMLHNLVLDRLELEWKEDKRIVFQIWRGLFPRINNDSEVPTPESLPLAALF